MRYAVSSVVVAALIVCSVTAARADEVTVIGPGGVRAAMEKIIPLFEARTGHKVKATFGSGGTTHQQVVKGEPFDVPIVQPPYDDVIKSGNVIPATETVMAGVPIAVVIRKGAPRPDLSSTDAVKKWLLAAKGITYPNAAGGAAAGVSLDNSFKKAGVYDQMMPKVKRMQGVNMYKMLTDGDIDYVITFASEIPTDNPDVEAVGNLPKDFSTPTGLVAFQSAHAKAPAAARALLDFLKSPEAVAVYKECRMIPGKGW